MRCRGFTVLEMLIAGTLLLLLSGVLTQALRSGLHVWTQSQRRAEAQQAALVVATRVSKDYHGAHPESVQIRREEVAVGEQKVRRDAVIFLSCLDDLGRPAFDEGGSPLWMRRVVIYHAGESNEVRAQATALDPPTSDPDPLAVDHFTPDLHDRIVARGVRALAFEDASLPLLRFRVESVSGDKVSVIDSTSLPVISSGAPPEASSPSPAPGAR